MRQASLVIIGDEILSGRTEDKNLAYLAKWLGKLGISLSEVRVVLDDEEGIIDAVNSLREKYDYVFTTGGIGPTHDDITSKSIAKAFKQPYGYHKEAYAILEKYYGPNKFNEGRKKMSMTPKKATLIYNPSSGAPGFIVENVFCLPGVPSILKSMVSGLKNKIVGGEKILSKTVSVNTVESEIAKSLEKVQNKYSKLEIGSYPFFRFGKVGVSIVIRSTKLKQIDLCLEEIINFLKKKNIKIIDRD